MPTFAPSVSKTAVVQIPVSPAELSCEAQLFLGPNINTIVATSGEIPFVSTGSPQSISLPVTMPSAAATYHVYLAIYSAEVLLQGFVGNEDVTISAPQLTFDAPVVTVVQDIGAPAWKTANFSCRVTNNSSQTITRTLSAWERIQNGAVDEVGGGMAKTDSTWPGRIQVTLSPGQSYTYYFEGNYQYDSGWYVWVMIPQGGWLQLWLQDNLGNKSPESPRLT